MTGPKTIVCVVGTRPEAVKMAPLILALRAASWARVIVVASGQHEEMLAPALASFGIVPDMTLSVRRPGQSLAAVTAGLMAALDPVIESAAPDMVLAQGDTTTVFVAAMLCFYRGIPFGHVEAGLRTGDVANPFPEEFNRRAAGMLAALHFAPTEAARVNLLREGTRPEAIVLSGNTGIDALHAVVARPDLPAPRVAAGRRLILLTAHRRENFGAPLASIYSGVRRLVDAFADIEVICPVYPNPAVRVTADEMLTGHDRIRLTEPADYPTFVGLLKACMFVMTDSGGIQEEAPALGKPVLVLRHVTERPEAVASGVARCIGTDAESVFNEAARLLTDPAAYAAMARMTSPYGDGRAAERIVAAIAAKLLGHLPSGASVPPPL